MKKKEGNSVSIIFLVAVLAACMGRYDDFWDMMKWVGILFAVEIVAVMIGSVAKKNRSSGGSFERARTRTYVPHYVEEDEYVCGICGARFDRAYSTCPHCGVIFNSAAVDEDEYDEELEDELEMDDWDEEEGR